MRVAVTGSTGFVGGAVVRAARAHGHRVYAYGRRAGAELVWDITSELADPPEVDVVVHAAAAVTDWGPAAPILAASFDGTRRVAATFPGARLIHLSSASVYDPFRPTVTATEDRAPVTRYLTAYQDAKAQAERVLSGRAEVVILRPHAVYGPGDPTLMPRVLGAVRGRNLFIVGDGRVRQSLTSIDNLVQAVLLGFHGPAGVYNVADDAPVILQDAVEWLLAERGIQARVQHLPRMPSWYLAGAAEALLRAARRPHPPRLTRYAISHLAVERTLDLTRARTDLGYRPDCDRLHRRRRLVTEVAHRGPLTRSRPLRPRQGVLCLRGPTEPGSR